MNFFAIPHIPNKRSKSVIISCDAPKEAVIALKRLGIQTIPSYKSEKIHSAVAAHPDMTILHLGDNRFVCSPDSYEYYRSNIPEAEIIKGSVDLDLKYPNDISYNITILNDYVFLNAASNQIKIFKSYSNSKKKILNVNQGYTKCNICIVNSNAIITSDTGIHKTAIENKINSLLIEPEHIKLTGMNYGFIGGAAGLVAPDVLAVCGDINTHPNGGEIISYCAEYGVDVVSLKSGEIYDIGSILPVF